MTDVSVYHIGMHPCLFFVYVLFLKSFHYVWRPKDNRKGAGLYQEQIRKAEFLNCIRSVSMQFIMPLKRFRLPDKRVRKSPAAIFLSTSLMVTCRAARAVS